LFDLIDSEKEVSKESWEKFLKLLNPICPHITEELWSKLGNKEFISNSEWPSYDEKKLKIKKKQVDLNSKIIDLVKGYLEGKKVKKIYLYVMPFEKDKIDIKKISSEIEKEIFVYATNDSKKYDPSGKSKKARPGMPGVWFE
jgi:leucyl-tRNA synthetase